MLFPRVNRHPQVMLGFVESEVSARQKSTLSSAAFRVLCPFIFLLFACAGCGGLILWHCFRDVFR